VDGKIIGEGALPALEPCAQVVVTATWPWAIGRHKVTLQVFTNEAGKLQFSVTEPLTE